MASPSHDVPAGECVPTATAAGVGQKRSPSSPGRRSTGSSTNCCRGDGGAARSCGGGWKTPSGAINGRNARTPNAGRENRLKGGSASTLADLGARFLPSCSIGLRRLVVVILDVRPSKRRVRQPAALRAPGRFFPPCTDRARSHTRFSRRLPPPQPPAGEDPPPAASPNSSGRTRTRRRERSVSGLLSRLYAGDWRKARVFSGQATGTGHVRR